MRGKQMGRRRVKHTPEEREVLRKESVSNRYAKLKIENIAEARNMIKYHTSELLRWRKRLNRITHKKKRYFSRTTGFKLCQGPCKRTKHMLEFARKREGVGGRNSICRVCVSRTRKDKLEAERLDFLN